jgi:hypothetical protein
MTPMGSDVSFPEEVRAAFLFLEDKGFVATIVSRNEVRYECDKVYVVISYGDRDGEVSISFGRKGRDEKFSFTLFLRLVNPALEKALGERMAHTPTQLRKCLDDLANALLREGAQILAGEDFVFQRMKRVRWWDFKPEALK